MFSMAGERLIPRFSGFVQISDKSGREIFLKKFLNEKEASQFIDKYAKHKQGFGLFASLFCPMEISSKDLFFPSLSHFALKSERTASKVIMGVCAVFADLVTFVPRVIAMPFRAAYLKTHPDQPHPLSELFPKAVYEKLLQEGLANIKVQLSSVKVFNSDDEGLQREEERVLLETHEIALRRLHGVKEKESLFRIDREYEGKDGVFHVVKEYIGEATSSEGVYSK